jgi:acetoin utilization deacetylase AcuC-like enzyme
MKIFYSEKHLLHDPQQDWEVADRGVLILSALMSAKIGEVQPPHDWGMAPITAVHTPNMIHFLQTAFTQMQKEAPVAAVVPNNFAVRHLNGHLPRTIWGQLGHFCTDSTTPILANTWSAAYWSAQVALSAANYVSKYGETAYALCRPPGHHAYADLYGGYCYLNNAAIAAHWLTQQQYKVAIVDIDYHHGNGTQSIFYARDDVLFCSIHADPNDEYPFYCGFVHEKGDWLGYGRNLNYPLPLGTTGAAYLKTVERAITEVVQFNPDILLISFGVDTIACDPNGGFLLTTNDFAAMGQAFAEVNVPKVVVQEGGYLLNSIGANVLAFLQALD